MGGPVTVLLVDDRDGRIVSELESEEDVRAVLEAWTNDAGGLPEYLCLIDVKSHRGTLFGTDSSMKIRPL